MILKPISIQKLSQLPLIKNDYSLVQEYFGDPLYHGENYIWAFVYSTKDTTTPIGVVCLTDDKFLENYMHLSVFEVAEPIRGMGYGTQIMLYLKEFADKLNYSGITLMCHEPSLSTYYGKFGFGSTVDENGTPYMVWNNKKLPEPTIADEYANFDESPLF